MPLKIQLLPIPVVQIQTFPAQSMKVLQSLFGTLKVSNNVQDGKEKPVRYPVQAPKNDLQNPLLNRTQFSNGTAKPVAPNNSDYLQINSKQVQQVQEHGYFDHVKPLPTINTTMENLVSEEPSVSNKEEQSKSNFLAEIENKQHYEVDSSSTGAFIQSNGHANATNSPLMQTELVKGNTMTGAQSKIAVNINLPTIEKIHDSMKTSTSEPPTLLVKCPLGNSSCSYPMSSTSKISTSASSLIQTTTESNDIASSLSHNTESSTTSNFHRNGSQFVHAADTTTINLAGQLTTNNKDFASPDRRQSKKLLTVQRKMEIKTTPVTSLAKNEYVKQGSLKLPISQLKKPYKPIRIRELMRARIQDQSINKIKAFTKKENLSGSQAPIWIQQGNIPSDPLMLADLHAKHDSVFPAKPDVYGN